MNANLISFVDVVTLIFQERDASYHGCSNRKKCYLKPCIRKSIAWWVTARYVTMQATGYGKQVNWAIYFVILELQKINLQKDPDKIRMTTDIYCKLFCSIRHTDPQDLLDNGVKSPSYMRIEHPFLLSFLTTDNWMSWINRTFWQQKLVGGCLVIYKENKRIQTFPNSEVDIIEITLLFSVNTLQYLLFTAMGLTYQMERY
jgi:hypothetical protein